jgi:hypothetical protein
MANRMIRKLPTWLLIGGLSFAGFALVFILKAFNYRGHAVHGQQNVSHSGDNPAPAAYMTALPKSSGSTGLSVSSSVHGQLESSSTATALQRTSSGTGNAPQDTSRRSNSGLDTEDDSEDPGGVVGRPFPISTSVENLCRKLSSKDDDHCAFTHRLLEDFAQQPRDPVWASNMESKLRALVMSQAGYTIRTIECRTSLCVAEVASLYGMFHFITAVGKDSPLHQSLMNGQEWQTAYEHDPSGSITVTLMIFGGRQ